MLSAKQIAPGQSGQIEVKANTQGLTVLSKTVTVTTNDPRQPQVILTVNATVQPEFTISEKSVYFGNVPRGQEVVKEFFITIQTGRNLKILSAESTDANFSVRMEPVQGSNGARMRVVATQKADAKDGYHFGFLLFKTNSTLNPELRVSIRGMVGAGRSNQDR